MEKTKTSFNWVSLIPPIICVDRGDDGVHEGLGGVEHDAAGGQHGQVVEGLDHQGQQGGGQWPTAAHAWGPSETESNY